MTEINASIDRLGLKIDGLGDKVDDLAVQVGTLTSSIGLLGGEIKKLSTAIAEQKGSIDGLIEESRSHNETAKIQAQSIERLASVVDKLVSRN